MKETLKVSGKKLELPKTKSSDWKFFVRPGGWILAESIDSRGNLVRKRFLIHQRANQLTASLDGRLWHGELIQTSHGLGGSSGGSDADLTAQFPGKVRKILVKSGAQVNEGDSLMMIEAMKMEFPVKAPYNGRITQIHVQEGQQINPGTKFLDLEAQADG